MMNNWQKIGLFLLIIGTLAYVKIAFFSKTEEPIQTEEPKMEQPVEKNVTENENVPKSYVNVYFIGLNKNKEEVYKVVKRSYNAQKDGTKLKAAITDLLKGPSKKEKAMGIYSEVPQSTKLLSIEEKPDKVIINLNDDFEQGGGTDGLYKRLYQLIKTSSKNTTLDVYLYLNGKQVDVIGGEGIMLNQPLNNKSLDD